MSQLLRKGHKILSSHYGVHRASSEGETDNDIVEIYLNLEFWRLAL